MLSRYIIKRILLLLLVLAVIPVYGQNKADTDAGADTKKQETDAASDAVKKNRPDPAPVAAVNLSDEMKFRNAMEFIRLERQNRALEELNEYLEIYIQGAHRDEAYRQIARIHCENFDYLKAVKAYGHLYEEYGSTESGIEGYFNMGLCYGKMGYREKARLIFEEIVRDHSELPCAAKAATQLDLVKIVAGE